MAVLTLKDIVECPTVSCKDGSRRHPPPPPPPPQSTLHPRTG